MQTDPDPTPRSGALIAIGGNEDRRHDMTVLRQALDAARPSRAGPTRVAVLTAASGDPVRQWESYREAFERLGAAPTWLDLRTRADADADAASCLALIDAADLVFMSGGDQERLTRLLDGSPAHRRLLQRQRQEGLCIAGTSAGASALGTLMPGVDIAEDSGSVLETSDDPIPHGLGFVRGVVIDQHFSQRRRLARLINLVSREGRLVGLGLDEDTAAILRPGPSLTVVGSGSVTLVDCRGAPRNKQGPTVVSVRNLHLHRLGPGATLNARADALAESSCEAIDFGVLLP